MRKKRAEISPLEEILQHLVRRTEDLFILHAIQAGVPSHVVASMLKVRRLRVSSISKHLKDKK